MKVSDVLQQNFFSILVSKNREVYIDALFVIRKAFQNEMNVSRSDIISMLISNMEDEIKETDFSEDDFDDKIDEESSSAKAHFLIRKLKSTGWIDLELQPDSLDEYVVIPYYASDFINILYSLTEENKVEYGGYVHDTFVALRDMNSTNNEIDLYEDLKSAERHTKKLVDSLKRLYNSLSVYHKKLCNKDNINEIIREHFVDYKTLSDQIIYPLITKDSIPRYKGPIIDLIDEIILDKERIDAIKSRGIKVGDFKDENDATEQIFIKLQFLKDTYIYLNDNMIDKIQFKNNEYVRTSTNRINYLLTSDKEIKGKLIKALKNFKNQEVIEKMQESITLVKQETISKDSIFIRYNDNKRKKETPMKIQKDDDVSKDEIKNLIEQFKSKISNQMVKEYMAKVFGDKKYVNSTEISINSIDDFIMIIMSTIKTDKMFYTVEYKDDKNIINNGYEIPNMRFVRR